MKTKKLLKKKTKNYYKVLSIQNINTSYMFYLNHNFFQKIKSPISKLSSAGTVNPDGLPLRSFRTVASKQVPGYRRQIAQIVCCVWRYDFKLCTCPYWTKETYCLFYQIIKTVLKRCRSRLELGDQLIGRKNRSVRALFSHLGALGCLHAWCV